MVIKLILENFSDTGGKFDELPDLVPPSVFARCIGCSTQTVRDMLHRGALPGVKIGKRLFVVRREFLEQLETGVYSL